MVEVAVGEKGVAYAPLFGGLLDRVLRGVRLMISHDHERIKAAVWSELVGAEWQRCILHFQRNALSRGPTAPAVGEFAEDLKLIKVKREKSAQALVEEFVSL